MKIGKQQYLLIEKYTGIFCIALGFYLWGVGAIKGNVFYFLFGVVPYVIIYNVFVRWYLLGKVDRNQMDVEDQ